jgi:hypothetical protein
MIVRVISWIALLFMAESFARALFRSLQILNYKQRSEKRLFESVCPNFAY